MEGVTVEYLARLPDGVSAGQIIVHNYVRPTRRLNSQPPEDDPHRHHAADASDLPVTAESLSIPQRMSIMRATLDKAALPRANRPAKGQSDERQFLAVN
jgi:hypothetical protein